MTIASLRIAGAALLATGCAGCSPRAPSRPVGPARVEILAPAEGDTVALPFRVRLRAIGVEAVRASGVSEPGRGHHHLVVDLELPDLRAAIGTHPRIVHLGNGAQEHSFTRLPAGPHRIIALFAGGDDIPMRQVSADTVRFVVR